MSVRRDAKYPLRPRGNWPSASCTTSPFGPRQGLLRQALPPESPTPAHALGHSRSQAPVYGVAPPSEAESGKQTAPVGDTAASGTEPSAQAVVTRGRASWQEVLTVLALSTFLAALLWHNAWRHPFSTQVGVFGDADEYTWFLGWVPYAIGHGLNPLGSTFVNFPHGVNLMWNTSLLLPSFLMSPITVIFGAAFSYNVLATAAISFSTTFAYMAFRRWTSPLPSLAGALIFGFSSYMVAQSVGHLAQTFVMSAPLLLIVLDRLFVVQTSKPWVDGLMLGGLAWAQLLTGEEVLAVEAVAAAIGLFVLIAINDRAIFPHVRYAVRGLVVGGASFLVLSLPFLAYQFLGKITARVQKRPRQKRLRKRPTQLRNPHQNRSLRPRRCHSPERAVQASQRLGAGRLHRYPTPPFHNPHPRNRPAPARYLGGLFRRGGYCPLVDGPFPARARHDHHVRAPRRMAAGFAFVPQPVT